MGVFSPLPPPSPFSIPFVLEQLLMDRFSCLFEEMLLYGFLCSELQSTDASRVPKEGPSVDYFQHFAAIKLLWF